MIVYSQVAQIGKLCYPDNRNHFTAHIVLYKVCFANPAFSAKSSKQKKAEQYIIDGLDIEIVPESVFYEIIENYAIS